MQMPELDELTLWYALNRLIIGYWDDVDRNGGSRAHEFYLPDALYSVGDNRFVGVDNIRAFYERRRERGNATTRHLINNLLVFPNGALRARMVGTMSLYRADGHPPIDESRPLSMIADFEAWCVLGDDRQWRLESHVLRPIFIGSNRPFSITVDSARVRAGRG
jgi:hypothetical protein